MGKLRTQKTILCLFNVVPFDQKLVTFLYHSGGLLQFYQLHVTTFVLNITMTFNFLVLDAIQVVFHTPR